MPVIPPAGLSPLGFHETAETEVLLGPPVIAAEIVDLTTGELESVLEGMHPIDQQVVEALARVRGSGAAVTAHGSRFVDIAKISDDVEDLARSHAENALAQLVARGDIAIVRVETVVGDDWIDVTVVYLNRRTRSTEAQRRPVRIPFGVMYGTA